jgi:hypothetical protein
VLSLNLADMGGWDFLAARQKDPVLLLTPIIVMSTETEVPREISPDMFLQKPFGFERFLQIVARILDWSSPDAERRPRTSEPWSLDDRDPHVVKNSFGQPVVFATSSREARRIAAAVNGVTRLSTEALEQGIVDKGLKCLYELNRYENDDAFRTEIDPGDGLESIRKRRQESAATLGPGEIGARCFPNDPLTIVPLALGLATVMASAEDAILLAANIGGDSDSVASIAGGILGAMYPNTVNRQWYEVVETVNNHGLAALANELARLRH